MRIRPWIWASALACTPLLSMAQEQGIRDHFSHGQRMTISELEDTQIDYLVHTLDIERIDLMVAAGSILVRYSDLNNDGKNEIFLKLDTVVTCSNGVVACHILVLRGWSTEPLLRFYGHLLFVDILPEEDWARLVGIRATPGGTIERTDYKFIGGEILRGADDRDWLVVGRKM